VKALLEDLKAVDSVQKLPCVQYLSTKGSRLFLHYSTISEGGVR